MKPSAYMHAIVWPFAESFQHFGFRDCSLFGICYVNISYIWSCFSALDWPNRRLTFRFYTPDVTFLRLTVLCKLPSGEQRCSIHIFIWSYTEILEVNLFAFAFIWSYDLNIYPIYSHSFQFSHNAFISVEFLSPILTPTLFACQGNEYCGDTYRDLHLSVLRTQILFGAFVFIFCTHVAVLVIQCTRVSTFIYWGKRKVKLFITLLRSTPWAYKSLKRFTIFTQPPYLFDACLASCSLSLFTKCLGATHSQSQHTLITRKFMWHGINNQIGAWAQVFVIHNALHFKQWLAKVKVIVFLHYQVALMIGMCFMLYRMYLPI